MEKVQARIKNINEFTVQNKLELTYNRHGDTPT